MSGVKKKSILFLPQNKNVDPSQNEESLLELALKNKIAIDHTCGGFGTCGTCVIDVAEGLELLPEKSGEELERSNERQWPEHRRLACQIPPTKGLVIKVPGTKD